MVFQTREQYFYTYQYSFQIVSSCLQLSSQSCLLHRNKQTIETDPPCLLRSINTSMVTTIREVKIRDAKNLNERPQRSIFQSTSSDYDFSLREGQETVFNQKLQDNVTAIYAKYQKTQLHCISKVFSKTISTNNRQVGQHIICYFHVVRDNPCLLPKIQHKHCFSFLLGRPNMTFINCRCQGFSVASMSMILSQLSYKTITKTTSFLFNSPPTNCEYPEN